MGRPQAGARCTVVVPDGAPRPSSTQSGAWARRSSPCPTTEWWNILATHRYQPLEPARTIHPVSDVGVMAGNGTIGLEILEDLPEVDVVLVPFGGGGP